MKQKADHHLEFLADKNDRTANPLLPLQPFVQDARPVASTSTAHLRAQPSPLPVGSQRSGGGDEDAAGESDDAAGEIAAEEPFRTAGEASAPPKRGADEQAKKSTPRKPS